MSWSANRIGTVPAVSTAIALELDKCASNYKGQTEEQDVLAAKTAVLSALSEMNVAPDNYSPSGYGVDVKCNGSRSTYSVTINVQITRVALTL